MSIEIKLTRIDKRLLHATVALNWYQFLDVGYVLIVDPNYAKDPFIADVMQLCLPKTMKLKMFSVENFLEFINQEFRHTIKAMVIFPNLSILEEAVKMGFRIKEIQLPYPASRMMIKKLPDYFNEEDIRRITYIQSQGIKLFFQTAPFESKDYSTFKNK